MPRKLLGGAARPRGVSIAEGCRLMRIGRSTFYDGLADKRSKLSS
jgi:hypothetical protein